MDNIRIASSSDPVPVKRRRARPGVLPPRPGVDRRRSWPRRFKTILNAISAEVAQNGSQRLTESQQQLCRRAATLSIECEQLECARASGAPIDTARYASLTGYLARTFARLGLHGATPRDDGPTLQQYIADRYGSGASEALK